MANGAEGSLLFRMAAAGEHLQEQGEEEKMEFTEQLVQQLINGISLGSIYALIALGYTMVYGIIKLINFAHGDIYMVGAYIGFFAISVAHLSIVPALIVSMVVTGLLGVLVEKLAYKPLRHVLFALKAAGNQLHQRLTLASTNEEILRNLRYIASRKPVTLRYVVIPGYTDDEAEINSLIRLLSSLDCVDLQVDVLGYHVLGVYKWAELGMPYTLEGVPAASKADVLRVKEMLKQAGIKLAYE